MTYVYNAAPLFKASDAMFNTCLVKALEFRKYTVFSPQRDGFLFTDLIKALAGKVAPEEQITAARDIIYVDDMDKVLTKSDAIVANLDEELDSGVIVETCYARMAGKLVVGFRTDVRTPFGAIDDPLKGLHCFPAYQCDKFIPYGRCVNSEEFRGLAEKIDAAIKNVIFDKRSLPKYALENPAINAILKAADALFSGIQKPKESLDEIAGRYAGNRSLMAQIRPIIV